jgi:hypothetical protein
MGERKDFKKWITDVVYEQQMGLCAKCGCSLEQGFHKHHIDGDASNNSVENLQLLCSECHGGEQYKTLKEQRIKHLQQIDNIIDLASAGEVSGAVIDKITELIKLGLGLENKVYSDVELPPINIRLQSNIAIQQLLLKEYQRGFEEGLKTGYNILISTMTSNINNMMEQLPKDQSINELLKNLKEDVRKK